MTDNTGKPKSLTEDGLENSTKGVVKEAVGRVKDAAGGLTGDTKLQAEGKVDELKGKVQNAFGKAERMVDDKTHPRGDER